MIGNMVEHDVLLGKDLDGKYIYLSGGEPVVLHARTGTGKTADWALPVCYTFPGSLVVLDIKGEAFAKTAGHRAAMGQDVYLFAPASRTGHSHRWDPMAVVDRNSADRFEQIARQASLLFPEIDQIGGGSNHNKFWDDAARQAFMAGATILAETGDEPLTMQNIFRVFSRLDGHEWLADKITARRASGEDNYSELGVDGISDYIGDDPKLRGDIRKAQPVDSLVLTPSGFRPIGSLQTGDLVQTPNGLTVPVVGVFPQGKKEIFQITFHDGRTARCCDEHLWKSWSAGRGGSWKIRTTADLIKILSSGNREAKELAVPIVEPCAIEFPPQDLPIPPYALGALLGDGSMGRGTGVAIGYSTADQASLQRLQLDLPDYNIISTGHNKGYDYTITMKNAIIDRKREIALTQANAQCDVAFTVFRKKDGGLAIKKSLETTGPIVISCGGESHKISVWAKKLGIHRCALISRLARMTTEQALEFMPREKPSMRHHPSPLRISLERLDLLGRKSHDKFVPDAYKRGSVAQRLALLQGLMDTDGWVAGNRTSAMFGSTSERLARDVQEIARSLGAIAKIAPRQTYYTHKGTKKAGRPSWDVSIVHPDISMLFSLPRKVALCKQKTVRHRLRIVSIERVGQHEAVCIEVAHPDHLYVTDNYVVTHNTVSTKLQNWYNPKISAVTSTSDFDLRDLRRRPMTIYVSVPPGMIQYLRPLLRLFFDQLINANTDVTPEEDPTLTQQTLILLDEFARLGRVDVLAQAAQYTRGYGLRLAYIVQNKAQVQAIYGHDAASDIFNNAGAEIVFGTADLALTRELEERMGDQTVIFTTRNKPRFLAWLNPTKQAESEHLHRRPLMLKQEIAQMPPGEQLIIRPGMRPMRTLRCRWFTDPAFVARLRPPPEIPKLKVVVKRDDGTSRINTEPPNPPATPPPPANDKPPTRVMLTVPKIP